MESATGPSPELTRAVARLSANYLLRCLRLVTDLHQGELLNAIICQAIIGANTRHLTHPTDAERQGFDETGLPPDEARKPISILALADSLGLPFETTRRHVARLEAAGACKRVRGGVIVPSSALADQRFYEAAQTSFGYTQQFVRNLRRAGVPID
ncbi:MAG TPA: hypothetical protein VHW60_08035 [Caulobacteraceae bacterium]|jgi:hypothetical protein|nr:hypothetical protein [Caulobacteraceae bacterium]